MQHPEKGRSGDFWFEVHEKNGLVALALLTIFWCWTAVRRGDPGLGSWLPYFSANRRRALADDIRLHLRALLGHGLPRSDEQPLANAVHGLGALTALGTACTGAAGYFLSQKWALSIHGNLAVLMWAYFGGHVLMSLIHEFARDPVLRNMFVFRAKK